MNSWAWDARAWDARAWDARAWGTWDADRPACWTHLPSGLAVRVSAFSTRTGRATGFPFGPQARLGPRLAGGGYAEVELAHDGARLRVRFAGTPGGGLAGDVEVLETREWGLRFWFLVEIGFGTVADIGSRTGPSPGASTGASPGPSTGAGPTGPSPGAGSGPGPGAGSGPEPDPGSGPEPGAGVAWGRAARARGRGPAAGRARARATAPWR
jgi:hypothetical protein